jgi:hypothetical protein
MQAERRLTLNLLGSRECVPLRWAVARAASSCIGELPIAIEVELDDIETLLPLIVAACVRKCRNAISTKDL